MASSTETDDANEARPTIDDVQTPAALKALAIPELLEKILLHLAHDQAALMTLPPLPKCVSSLFKLLRVDRGFKNTIDGSAKLQRFMFLTPFDENSAVFSDNAWPDHAPAVWLVRRMGLGQCGLRYSHDSHKIEVQAIYHGLLPTCKYMLAAFERKHPPGSSWSQMRAVTRRGAAVAITISVYARKFDAVEDADGPIMELKWLLTADATLKEVYEKYCELLRVVEKHAVNGTTYERLSQKGRKDMKFTIRQKLKKTMESLSIEGT